MKVKIHREGLNILLALLVVLLAINVPLYLCLENRVVPIVTISISTIFYLLVVNFFRSPRRHFKGDPENAVVASVDGKVVALEEVYEDEYLHRNVIQLSIFMTVFNVHANWTPVAGVVKYVKHHSGRFLAAYLPKSSTENERSTIVIETADGTEILMRQIAGAIARRIVTYVQEGDSCFVDEHLGFIKLGSRVDLFLPLDAEIKVAMNQKTVGNETVIAHLASRTSHTE